MTMMFSVIFTVLVILASVEEGLGLKCLQCKSKDFEGRCRLGQRNHHSAPKRQSCFGQNAKCFALASVTETGESTFERGCSTRQMCGEHEESDIEFCFTCQSTFCNYDVMELDKEVEDYLTEVLEYEKSLIAKTSTTSSTTTTTQSPSIRPKRKYMNNNSSRYISSKYGVSRQDSTFNLSQQYNEGVSSVVSQKNSLPGVLVESYNDQQSLNSNKNISNGAADLHIPGGSQGSNQVVVNNSSYYNTEIISEAKHGQEVHTPLLNGISSKTHVFNDSSIEKSSSSNNNGIQLDNSSRTQKHNISI